MVPILRSPVWEWHRRRVVDAILSVTNQHIRRQLVMSLRQLVETGVEQIGEDEVAGILRELLADFEAEEGGRHCRYRDGQDRSALILYYDTAGALEREIPLLTEVRGLMVDVETAPPMMESLDVVIQGQGSDREVLLEGRAVQGGQDKVALELSPTATEHTQALSKMVEQMRDWVAGGGLDRQKSQVDELDARIGQEETEVGRPGVDPGVPHVEVSEATMNPSSQAQALGPGNARRQGLVEGPREVDKYWSLDKTDVDRVLLEAATLDIQGYGLLEFVSDDKIQQLVLHFGELVGFRCDPPAAARRLVAELRSLGTIDAEQLRQIEQIADDEDRPIEDILIDHRAISHEELVDATKRRLSSQLQQLWGSQSADEAFLYSVDYRPIPEIRCSLSVMEHIVDHLRNRFVDLSDAQRQRCEDRFSGLKIGSDIESRFPLEQLGLKTKEQRFLAVLTDTPKTLFELNRITRLHRDELLSMLLILDQLDCLTTHEHKTQSPEERRITEFLDRIDRSDNYFELFGLHWSADKDEIEATYTDLRDQLDVSEQVETSMADELEKARQALENAYEVLSRRSRRRAHRNEHVDEYSQRMAVQMYEDKIESLQMRTDKSELLKVLKRYLELRPGDDQAKQMAAAIEQKMRTEARS